MALHGMEQVLNRPLSGAEVRQIILQKIETMLAGDLRISDFVAFPAFRFHADIAIVLQGAVEAQIERSLEGGQGELGKDPKATIQNVLLHTEQKEMPPNEARIKAGLGVPVLTRDATGREVETVVKYEPEVLRKAEEKTPENTSE